MINLLIAVAIADLALGFILLWLLIVFVWRKLPARIRTFEWLHYYSQFKTEALLWWRGPTRDLSAGEMLHRDEAPTEDDLFIRPWAIYKNYWEAQMSTIISPNDPIAANPEQAPAPNDPSVLRVANAVIAVAQRTAQEITSKLMGELADYTDRNKVPPNEVQVKLTTYKNRPGLVSVEIFRAKNGIQIIGTPKRQLKVKWSVK